MSAKAQAEAGKSKTADALSVEGWRRGVVHEWPGV
jgi:hypothetical protein